MECLKLLLEAGADPTIYGEVSNNPCQNILRVFEDQEHVAAAAIRTGSMQCLDVLLSFGINFNPKSEDEESPLAIAVKKNKPDIVLLLLRGGADPNVRGRVLNL